MRRLPLILFFALGVLGERALAVTPLEAILSARREVILRARILEDRNLAQALHQALVVRGVRVYLILDASGVELPYAYSRSLYLVGAQIRLFRGVPDALFGVVDGRCAIRAEKVTCAPQEAYATREALRQAFIRGARYEPDLAPAGFVKYEDTPWEDLVALMEESLVGDLRLQKVVRELKQELKRR